MNRQHELIKHMQAKRMNDKTSIKLDPIIQKNEFRYSNIIYNEKSKKANLNCLYLIQTSGAMPDLLSCLKKKNHVLLSFRENTPDTTIFFPKSTWTTGRNKIREHVLKMTKKYDYYIFLDEDIKFRDFSQEDGFNNFEKLLLQYQPYIANPNYVGYYPDVKNSNVRTTIEYDGMYNAFSKDAFFSNLLFPYIDKFDPQSWWMSQYVLYMLCSIFKKDVVLFTNIIITNENHSEYPRGYWECLNEVQKFVLTDLAIQKNNLLADKDKVEIKNDITWLHNNFKEIFPVNKKCIIITTINAPTKQILHYDALLDWDLIVVGDSKTDDSLYKKLNCVYLGLDEQKRLFPTIYDKIPLRSYTRKMFGYLYAIKNKYQVIYDTDDDNQYIDNLNMYENNFMKHDNTDIPGYDIKSIPLDHYDCEVINKEMSSTCASSFTYNKVKKLLFLKDNKLVNSIKATPNTAGTSGIFRLTKACNKQGFINLYKNYTKANIWPRGIPPNHASINIVPELVDELPPLQISIIQGLVNNDPDVDAHYRINVNNKPFSFEKDPGYDIVLDKNSVCPFNTQNTFWTDPSMFYAMYLPVTVTFRYTDILHGFVALYQLWRNNKTIKFTFPTAIQQRNEHDLQKDYESEVPMYQTAEQVINLLNTNKNATIEDMYFILFHNNIVKHEELDVLKEWLRIVRE